MNKVISTIEDVLPQMYGWCSITKGQVLAAAVFALRPEVIVEIGVFGGKSLFPMALAAKAIGRSTVWAIDPWEKAASIEGQSADNKYWWGTVDHEKIMLDFLRHVREHGLESTVKVCRAKSDNVEPPEGIGLLHIDGNHGEQALKDAQRFGPNVKVGGLCFCDDVNWIGGAVGRAVSALQQMGFTQLYSLDSGLMLQRV